MTASNKCEIDLGFAEECEPWLVTNTYFPSKIGGRPAWLNLENLPLPDEMKCSKCGESMVFLCQVRAFALETQRFKSEFSILIPTKVYASLEIRDDCFHRTIYVFICRSSSCWEVNCSK